MAAVELLRLKEVEERTRYSVSSIYRKVAAGQFPAPLTVGPNRVLWRAEQIAAWIEDQAAAGHVTRTRGRPRKIAVAA